MAKFTWFYNENEQKAERFAKIIISLIENEAELYRIVREYGDMIEWDWL